MATESESGPRPCSEDGCTNGTWEGCPTGDKCIMCDDSPAAEALKAQGRSKGGSRSPNRPNLPRLDPPPPPETAQDCRRYMTWAVGALTRDDLDNATFGKLRQGIATLLQAIDVADLEAEAAEVKARLHDELGVEV